jgi:hypothetical protein
MGPIDDDPTGVFIEVAAARCGVQWPPGGEG